MDFVSLYRFGELFADGDAHWLYLKKRLAAVVHFVWHFLDWAISYFIQTWATTGFKFEVSTGSIILVLIMGILSVIGNYAQFHAANAAPNPGIVFAIVGVQSSLVTLLAFVLFKDKVTPIQLAGILLGLISISMISLGSMSNNTAIKVSDKSLGQTMGK